MTTDPIVRVRGLSAGYDGRAILEDVSFDVHRGEVFVILGGSGCGKSTLLRCLIGLLPPLGGEVRVLGESLYELSLEKRHQLSLIHI